MTHLNHYYDDLLHWNAFVRRPIACSVKLQITRLTHCDNWFVNVFVFFFLFVAAAAAAFVLPVPNLKRHFSTKKPTIKQHSYKPNNTKYNSKPSRKMIRIKAGESECGMRGKGKTANWTRRKGAIQDDLIFPILCRFKLKLFFCEKKPKNST